MKSFFRIGRRPRLRWSLIAVTGLLVFGSGWTAYFVVQQFAEVHRLASYNLGADVGQSAIELYRLEAAVAGLSSKMPDASAFQAELWLSFLNKRCDELSQPIYTAQMANHPEVKDVIPNLTRALVSVGRLMPTLQEVDSQRQVLSLLQPFGRQLTALTSLINSEADQNSSAAFSRLGILTFSTFGLVVVLIAVVSWLVITVWMDDLVTQETMRRNADLAEESKSKTLMLAGVSHEVRTPLAAILGIIDLLSLTKLNDTQRDMVSAANTSGQTLLSLVNGMLDLSRSDSRDTPLVVSEFNLIELMASLAEMVRVSAKLRSTKLNVFVHPEISPWVKGDRDRLTKVFINLLSNAAKFTLPGGKITFYVLPTDERGHSLRFVVEDTGIGIAPDAQERIFDRFIQADNTIVDRFGGAGLGLATCRSLLKEHGGSISVTSEVGKGSCFSVDLGLPAAAQPDEHRAASNMRIIILSSDIEANHPIVQGIEDRGIAVFFAHAEKLSDFTERPADGIWGAILVDEKNESAGLHLQEKVSSATRHVPLIALRPADGDISPFRWDYLSTWDPINFTEGLDYLFGILASYAPSPHTVQVPDVQLGPQPLNILLADDNLTAQQVNRGILEHSGHKVTVVGNGRDVVNTLSRQTYDLVLMDINMPILNGLGAAIETRRLRNASANVPIIALTADGSDELGKRCHDAGIDVRLVKPVNPQQLLSTIAERMLLSKNRTLRSPKPSIERYQFESSEVDQRTLKTNKTWLSKQSFRILIETFHVEAEETLSLLEKAANDDDALFSELTHLLSSIALSAGSKRVVKIAGELSKPNNRDFPERLQLIEEARASVSAFCKDILANEI